MTCESPSCAGVFALVPESQDPNPRGIDWIGAILSGGGVTALVFGVIEEPLDGWTAPRVVLGLGLGIVVLAAFVAWDLRHPEPFVDMRLFRNPRFTWATIAFVVTGFALFGAMFILTPYLQLVQGNDAQATGIKLLPLIGAVIVGAGLGNRIAGRLGARIGIPAGLAITSAGLLILSRAGAGTGYGPIAVALAITGLGLGTALPTSLDVILSTLPPSQTGVGSALTRMLQQVAASFGVAILGSILSTAYRNSLDPHLARLPNLLRDAAQASLAGAAAAASHLPPALAGPLHRAARVAYADGMDQVMLLSAAVMLLAAAVIALRMPRQGSAVD